MNRRRVGKRSLLILGSAILSPFVAAMAALLISGHATPVPTLLAFLGAGIVAMLILRNHLADLAELAGWLENMSRGAEAAPAPDLGHPGTPNSLRRGAHRLELAWNRRGREIEAQVKATRTLLDSLPDPLIAIDSDRLVINTNRAAKRLLGTGLAGQDLASVLRVPQVLHTADGVLAEGGTAEVEFVLGGPRERDYSARIAGLAQAAADGTAAVIALYDLTAIKRSERLRADFVANASHELRTPLSVLVGCIETMQGPARDDTAAQRQFLETMRAHADRMARLVEDLLSLSRIELDEHTEPSERVDLLRIVRQVAELMDLQARAEGVEILVDLPDRLDQPLGDHDQLVQVLQNLIDNAIKYGRDGGTVRIEAATIAPASGGATEEGGLPVGLPSDVPIVKISVLDEGPGIPEEHLPRLTERFYRVDTARSRALGGTGLGLAIVKHILARHRGALGIESVFGEGSIFSVYMPILEDPE